MAVVQERETFMMNMKVKEEPINLQDFSDDDDYDDDDDEEEEEEWTISHNSSFTIEEKRSWETNKETRKRPLVPTHKTNNKEFCDNPHKSESFKRKRAGINYRYDHTKANSSVMERAEEVQANLATEFPSFVRSMIQSNVTRGFCVTLPKEFCHLHLPSFDTTVLLVHKDSKAYRVNYLVQRRTLSGGWKRFSEEHKLLVGDALVFQLVRPCKFKVYIVRANDLAEVDGALGLLNLDARAKNTDVELKKEYTGKRTLKPIPQENHRDITRRNSLQVSSANLVSEGNDSENNCEDLGSNSMEGITLSSGSAVALKHLSNKKFTILVNGLSIDSELSEQLRTKYYELCCSQKEFLHDHLLKNINGKLAAEIISETVKIADAISTCKLSTPQADFVSWEKTLIGFERLGMNVGFLRARLNRLVTLAFESKEAVKSKRYTEAKLERAWAKKEMRTLELKLSELQETMEQLDAEIEALEVYADTHQLMFHEEANAPW